MLFGRNSILSGLLTLFLVTEAAHCAAPAGTCAYDDVQSFLSCSTRYTTKQPKSVTRSTYTEFRTVSRAVTTTVTVDVVTSRDPNLLATTTITAHPTSTSTVLTVSSVTTVWTSTVTTSLYYTIYTTTTINPGTTTVVVTPPPRSVPTPVGFVAVLNDPTNSALYTDLPAKKFRRAAEPAPDPVSKPIAEPLAGPFAEPLPVGIPNVAPVGIGRRANYPVAVTCKKTIRVTFVTTITQTVGRRTSRLPGRTTTQTVHIPPTYWVHYTPTNAITLHWTESLVRTVGPSFTTTLTSTVTGNSTVTSYLPQQTVYAACGDRNRAPMPQERADFLYHISAYGPGDYSFRTNDTSDIGCCNACQARSDCLGSLWSYLQGWGAPCPWETDGLCKPGQEPVFPPDYAQCDLWLAGSGRTCSAATFRLANPYDEAPKVVSNGPGCARWKYLAF